MLMPYFGKQRVSSDDLYILEWMLKQVSAKVTADSCIFKFTEYGGFESVMLEPRLRIL